MGLVSTKSMFGFTMVALAACGGGGGKAGTVSDATAKSSTTTTITSSQAAIGNNGLAAAYQMAAIGTSAPSLVTPDVAGRLSAIARVIGTSHAQTGVCTCEGTSCHFEQCSDDQNGTLTLDGDLSWADNHVVADLSYAGAQQGTTYDFSVTMDVTLTDTSIDGDVATEGTVSTMGFDSTWDSSITFNAVVFNGAGCSTSGSIDVDATSSYAGQDYSGSSTITFDGSGC